jgi:hypothetical protein
MRQATIRENDLRVFMYMFSGCPCLAWGPPSPGPGTAHAPSLSLSLCLQVPPGPHHAPCFCFLSLTFNKLHLHPLVLPWILQSVTQRIWKSDHRLHLAANRYLTHIISWVYKLLPSRVLKVPQTLHVLSLLIHLLLYDGPRPQGTSNLVGMWQKGREGEGR